jgi:histidinol phosphatase-like PHP family hydrolase
VFAACAENNVEVEINSRPERQDPPDDLIQLALDAGCLFSIDSDAHAPGQLEDAIFYSMGRLLAVSRKRRRRLGQTQRCSPVSDRACR